MNLINVLAESSSNVLGDFISFAIYGVLIFLKYKLYLKMGLEGWKAFIPLYSDFVLYEKIYGNGWRFLLTIVPFYGVYVYCKCMADLAKGFGYEPAFTFGLCFMQPIFLGIINFEDHEWEEDVEDEGDKFKHAAIILTVILNIMYFIAGFILGATVLAVASYY